MQFKVTKVRKVGSPYPGKFWLVAKVSLFWLVAFALIVSSYVIWQQTLKFKDMEKRLDICQTNMERINEQVSSGRIILDLKKK